MAATDGLRFPLFVFAVFAAIAIFLAPDSARAARPNIIVIQTDDQSARTVKANIRGRDGKFRKAMPHTVRQIFNGGTEFRNYYATAPVCSPSRASLLTGQYPHSHGLTGNEGARGGWQGMKNLPIFNRNLAVSLDRSGYRTAHFGKLINGYYDSERGRVDTTVPPGWDRWFTTAFLPGTRYYGYEVNDDGFAAGPFGNPDYGYRGPGIDPKKCTKETLVTPRRGIKCRYLTDVMTRGVVKEIRQKGPRPLYIQVDYQGPHGDVIAPNGPQPATRHLDSASRTPLPRGANFNEADMSDKSKLIRGYTNNPLGGGKIRKLTKSYRKTLESLRAVDDGVGAIIKTLRKTGQLDNTYIFYLSDHGYFLGEHRFDIAKFLPYDASAKVAMAVRGPGVPKGFDSREVTGNIDIAATALSLAGVSSNYRVDGRSLKPFWRDPFRTSRRPVEISLLNLAGAEDNPGKASVSNKAPALRYRGFRVGPYKYFDFVAGGSELYDLARDPQEMNNVIDSPKYETVRQYMETWMPQVTNCSGSGCRQALPVWPQPYERRKFAVRTASIAPPAS